MAKNKKDNTILWVVISLVLLFLLLGFSKIRTDDDAKYATNDNSTTLDSSQTNNSALILIISPASPCMGNVVSGVITSNMPNAKCYLQYKAGILPWANMGVYFNLDSSGGHSDSTIASTTGRVSFRINCDGTLSNEQQIIIYDCGGTN